MHTSIRIALGGGACLLIALGILTAIGGPGIWKPFLSEIHREARGVRPPGDSAAFPDPNTGPGSPSEVFVTWDDVDSSISGILSNFTGPVHDATSLSDLRDAIRSRGRLALEDMRGRYDRMKRGKLAGIEGTEDEARLCRSIALAYMHDGKLAEADGWLERAIEVGKDVRAKPDLIREFKVLRGIAALRQGEVDNCLDCTGPSSCLFPLDPEATHVHQDGSRKAIEAFTEYLKDVPGDLRVRWLLNIAYMTVGEYPGKVPPRYLIPVDRFRSKIDVGRFPNAAGSAGLNVRGPNMAGGSVFDDFNNDGWPDLFICNIDPEEGASLFLNKGDGTFEDRSSWANLGEQVYALNLSKGDFDNDGNLDVLLMRGAWEKPARLSLLRNKGGGQFEDITMAAGLGEPIATESSAWADYDNDGRLDIFVSGEFRHSKQGPHNRSRLYHNEGGGKFRDVAEEAGIINEEWSKGSAWGDYDRDGLPDLFISNMIGPCRLFHNEGGGKFRNVGPEVGLDSSTFTKAFATWFWDYDNDGWPDLFINEYSPSLAETVAVMLGLPATDPTRCPHLLRNMEGKGFRDVSREVGLVKPQAAMGVNFGDIDNDGFLDVYFGTGWMSYSGLTPNTLLKNVGGKRFEDVTESSHTGHLQKGHGVSFADYDADGDLDFITILGGGYRGDTAYNALFRNPGHKRHWLDVKLVGKKTNRSAFGAEIEARIMDTQGEARSIHRTVGHNASFGGNSLTEHLGLDASASVAELIVRWPTSNTTQTFRDVPADQSIVITEGVDRWEPLRRAVPDKASR